MFLSSAFEGAPVAHYLAFHFRTDVMITILFSYDAASFVLIPETAEDGRAVYTKWNGPSDRFLWIPVTGVIQLGSWPETHGSSGMVVLCTIVHHVQMTLLVFVSCLYTCPALYLKTYVTKWIIRQKWNTKSKIALKREHPFACFQFASHSIWYLGGRLSRPDVFNKLARMSWLLYKSR